MFSSSSSTCSPSFRNSLYLRASGIIGPQARTILVDSFLDCFCLCLFTNVLSYSDNVFSVYYSICLSPSLTIYLLLLLLLYLTSWRFLHSIACLWCSHVASINYPPCSSLSQLLSVCCLHQLTSLFINLLVTLSAFVPSAYCLHSAVSSSDSPWFHLLISFPSLLFQFRLYVIFSVLWPYNTKHNH